MENNSKKLLKCLAEKQAFVFYFDQDPILCALVEKLEDPESDSKFNFIELISEILLIYSEAQLKLIMKLICLLLGLLSRQLNKF